MLKKSLLLCLLYLLTNLSTATTLEDIKPHPPTKKPWSEQWFYYLNDPAVGYFKVSLQTYIMPDAPDLKEKGYVHVVFTPLQGKTVIYDYYYDNVEVYAAEPGSQAFRYSIPGVVEASEQQLNLNLPDVSFSLQWVGNHQHYWSGRNPGKSPFGILTELPIVGSSWFIFTLGTPAQYSYQDSSNTYQGHGISHLDKGWYTQKSSGYAYVMATTEKVKLMLTGGADSGLPIELWTGRYLSEKFDLTFHPTIAGLGVKKTIEPCKSEMKIEFKKLTKKIIVHATANQDDFYKSKMNGVTVFGNKHPTMKTMNANINIKTFRFNKLVEEINLPQGLLEFSGNYYCDKTS